MGSLTKWTLIPTVLVLGVFTAGFFHESAHGRACAPEHVVAARTPAKDSVPPLAYRPAAHADGAGQLVIPDHLYHRTGDFACRVESVIQVYSDIETDVKTDFGGKLLSLEITGNDDGRQGTIQCAVSVDKFHAFITYIRKKGKVLSERITANAKPSAPRGGPDADELDERELSLVTVRMMDEKVAKEVGESKGMLTASLFKSTAHFLAGIAVIVEGLGWIAPYAAVLIALILPFAIVHRLRRRSADLDKPLGA